MPPRLLAGLIALALAGPTSAQELPDGYWPLARSQAVLDKAGTVRLAPDLTGLTPGERTAVEKLIEAGRILQGLYARQLHPEDARAYADLVALDARLGGPPATRNLLRLYAIASGPIIETDDNARVAFLPVALPGPGKALYPDDITKDMVDAWLAAHPEDRKHILSPRSVVRRVSAEAIDADLAVLERFPVIGVLHPGLHGRLEAHRTAATGLYAVPYSVAYPVDMLRVYALLSAAAEAVEPDDADFALYLRQRGRDLLTDDYSGGDAAWVTGRFKTLNAQIGGYETYDDELYGAKTFLGLSVLRMRPAETATLRAGLKDLQALEDTLPYTPRRRVRDDLAIGVYDVIADFGEPRGTNTASILPNDPDTVRRYGHTVLLRANLLEHPALFEMSRRAWQAAMAPAHAEELTAEGELINTVWHEVGHSLGPDRTRTGATLEDALGADSNVLEELKADLVALHAGEALRARGLYDADQLRALYASGMFRALLQVKPRRDQAYGTMRLVQWNVFLRDGLLRFDPASRTLTIDYARLRPVVGTLLTEVLALQQDGDAAAAEAFIALHTAWDETVHGAIAEKMRAAAPTHRWFVEYAAAPAP